MRTVGVISDLHLEFGSQNSIQLPDTDILVLAGDITVARYQDPQQNHPEARKARIGFQRFLDRIDRMPYTLVLAVLGNHEYYHGSWLETPDIMREAYDSAGVTLLHNQMLEAHDWRFAGGPLWTDMRGHNPLVMLQSQMYMNDYHLIFDESGQPIRPQQTMAAHFETRQLINEFLSAPRDQRGRFVITHHAPSFNSITPEYANSENGAFANNMDYIASEADVWAHGHVHSTHDYMIGDCRVVCNPYGYQNHSVNGLVDITIKEITRKT
jgi:predicted phosphodiesterase